MNNEFFSRFRFFATQNCPFIPGAFRPKDVNITFSDATELKFHCPRPSSWRSPAADFAMHKIDLTKTDDLKEPNQEQEYMPGDHGFRDIFYRDWSVYAPFWRLNPIAVISLTIRLAYVAKESPEDSLFVWDYYSKRIPDLHKLYEKLENHNLGAVGGGLHYPDRAFSYSRYQVDKGGQRARYDRFFVVLNCDHYVVFDFYYSRAPDTSRFLDDNLKSFCESLFDTVRFDYSQEVKSIRRERQKAYAEREGLEFDEDIGPLVSIDLSDS